LTFKNKHAVVTGGANGIGRCIAEAFLNNQAKVTIIDIDGTAAGLLQNRYENLSFFYGDIAEKSVLDCFVRSLEIDVDFLVNNACVSRKGILSDCSYEDFEYVHRVGVIAPYYLTSLFVKNNLLLQNASIINIASTRAFQSQPDTESYSAVKGGLVSLTHALAASLAGWARVNSVSPGWIETFRYRENSETPGHCKEDMLQHPVGRIGMPEDIAELVMYLCDEKSGFITGQNFMVDGGISRQMIYHGDYGWKLDL
jgi:NAD(P)-dependent dehydrogenase (short-subunit alcohol dehydrogenase family)